MLVVILQDHNSNNAAKIFMQMQYDTNLKNGSKLTYQQIVHATLTKTPFIAISKKVVGKSACDNPERDCGWF